MPTNLRRLGVYGDNLPVKKSKTVRASDFLIGGIMGRFERKYNKGFLVNNAEEFREIFGDHVISTYYGNDVVKGFWDNVVGVDAKLYVAAHVGNTGSAIDAVVASRTKQDDGAANSLKVEAGYQEEKEYGISGNRTGTKIELAIRYSTLATGTCAATGQSYLELASVIGIKVGDMVKFVASGGTPGTEYHIITEVNESLKRILWSGDFSATGAAIAIGDVVSVPGFTLKTYRKSINGVEKEVDIELGKIICTMESAVSDFYIENVFAQSKWIVVTDLDSASTLADTLFTSDTEVTYLENGADGTAPTTAAHWTDTLNLFDDFPVRFLCNAESTLEAIQNAGEAYCVARWDNPKWLYLIAENQTKSQLKIIGNSYQRSNEVDGVIVANWLKVEDPFSNSSIAPYRHVPNVGHVMGAWIRVIGQRGVHYVASIKQNPLYGVTGIVGDQFLDDNDRTEIAETGVNLIQELDGIGIIIRNFFTPSTDIAYQFANGILMKDYIKVSSVDSLQTSENMPNSINRIKEDKMAILQFLYKLWASGSTKSVPLGETFGQTQDIKGNESQPETHFEVKADLINNPQASINAGERNLDVHFSYPSPAGSVRIGVGIMLLS